MWFCLADKPAGQHTKHQGTEQNEVRTLNVVALDCLVSLHRVHLVELRLKKLVGLLHNRVSISVPNEKTLVLPKKQGPVSF